MTIWVTGLQHKQTFYYCVFSVWIKYHNMLPKIYQINFFVPLTVDKYVSYLKTKSVNVTHIQIFIAKITYLQSRNNLWCLNNWKW